MPAMPAPSERKLAREYAAKVEAWVANHGPLKCQCSKTEGVRLTTDAFSVEIREDRTERPWCPGCLAARAEEV